MGEVHPYVEKIAKTKWLNREFGYHLLPQDLDGENPALSEHELDWHFTYAGVFNDPEVREKAQKKRGFFERKGIFSAMYEFGGE